jgi:hypothetical protein
MIIPDNKAILTLLPKGGISEKAIKITRKLTIISILSLFI